MEDLNKECCVVTEQEDCCDSAATVNVYVNAKRHVNCGCGGSGTGSNPDATNDHDKLINKNLGIQHEASAVAFADGETFQQKYDNEELKGEAGEKGEAGVRGERGASGVFVPDYKNAVIGSFDLAAGFIAPSAGFFKANNDSSGVYMIININGIAAGGSTGYPGFMGAQSELIPVNAGDIVKISPTSTAYGITYYFYPPVVALLPASGSDLATQPQNWTAGTEIDFQDGSFGQRFTGAITAAADEFVNTELVSAVAAVISCGGTVSVDTNTPPTKGSVPFSGTVTPDGSVNLEANIINGQAKVSLFSKCSAARTNAEYDVWIRYTK